MNQIDISTITDINTLKAMAYDLIATKEQTESNLRVVNGRIQELSTAMSETGPIDDESNTTTTTMAPAV